MFMEINGKNFRDLQKEVWNMLVLPSVIRHNKELCGVEVSKQLCLELLFQALLVEMLQ